MMMEVKDLGIASYQHTWELQKKLQVKRIENKIILGVRTYPYNY